MKPRKYRQKKYFAPEYIVSALDFLKPPECLLPSQWAERHRRLNARSSAMPGFWRNSMTPYLVEIMDELVNPETEEIIFCKPSQVGGTEALFNCVGYTIMQDPGPTLIAYPTDELAEFTSENRIMPMLRDCPELRRLWDERRSLKNELQFANMYVSLVGSNNPAKAASRSIRWLYIDESDKHLGATKKEAGFIPLLYERTKAQPGHKIFQCSTPTLRTGPIWKAKEAADVEKHCFLPCPHCGRYIELKWSQVRFPEKDDAGNELSIAQRAEQAAYVCQECGALLYDRDKSRMLRRHQWRAVRQSEGRKRSVAFWMNTLYSPFVSFSDAVREWLLSQDDPERLQNFINSWLAEPWEDTKLKTSAALVMDRQTKLPAYVLPNWTKLLTAGVDVQETCLYWSIRAWGDYSTSQNIAHGQALNWDSLVDVMDLQFSKEDNSDARCVDLALIDFGDQTDEVYDFCAEHADWAVPCKGVDGGYNHVRVSRVNRAESRAYGMQLVLVDGGKFKDTIAARMRKPNGDRGSWMVHADCDLEYANQVTAEHKVAVRSGGKAREKWVPKASHAANHYLDCEVYAAAAAELLDVRALFLKNERDDGTPKTPAAPNEQRQLDIDMEANRGLDDWVA